MNSNDYLLTDPRAAFDEHGPRRVVSLVPSATASLFDLGLGGALVGVSDYCVLPETQAAGPTRVGGPKDARVVDILDLRPDLVLANREENRRADVEALAAAGITVWLAFPTDVHAAINDLWILANLFRSEPAMRQVDLLEKSLEWAEQAGAGQPPMRYFCPVWEGDLENGQRWWMTFNDQTYSASVLRIFGGENIFTGRERRYPLLADLGQAAAEDPGERDTRYPCVSLEEILAAQPELILLPSEPYAYNESHSTEFMDLFAQTPAVKAGRVFTLDGTLIHWPGTRLAQALEELPVVFGY